MKVNVKTRVSGFVPGETIEFTVNYNNNSPRVDITRMKLKLQKVCFINAIAFYNFLNYINYNFQNLVFYASSPLPDKKYSTEIIKKTKCSGPFPKHGEALLKIEVPSLPPSRLDNCSLIHINYKLIFTIYVSGM